MKWIYKNKEIDYLDDDIYGFVYLIEYSDGFKYIGKKQCRSYSTLPALKSGLLREGCIRIAKNVKGKRRFFDISSKESNWKSYVGSCKDERIFDLKVVKKTILQLAKNKINLTFNEIEWLVRHNVLRKQEYLNANIAGNFFKGRIDLE